MDEARCKRNIDDFHSGSGEIVITVLGLEKTITANAGTFTVDYAVAGTTTGVTGSSVLNLPGFMLDPAKNSGSDGLSVGKIHYFIDPSNTQIRN